MKMGTGDNPFPIHSCFCLSETHLEHEEGHEPSLLLTLFLSLLRENVHAIKLVKCLPISKMVSVAWETDSKMEIKQTNLWG